MRPVGIVYLATAVRGCDTVLSGGDRGGCTGRHDMRCLHGRHLVNVNVTLEGVRGPVAPAFDLNMG